MRQTKYQIYLAGACKGLTYEQADKWRGECQNWAVWKDDVYMYNPNDIWNYWDKQPPNNSVCMNTFLAQLRQSDLVLVNLDYSENSVGTGIEVAMAHELGIPVVGFTRENEGVYPWIRLMCEVEYDNTTDLRDMLADIYMTRVEG